MPFVTPRIRWGEMPCQVASAVSAWSWLTALASWVRRSEKPVMSKIDRVALRPEAQLEDRVDRDAAGGRPAVAVEERPGDPPDEVRGEALVARGDRRVDREDAVAPDPVPGRLQLVAGGDELPRPLGQQERGVALVQVPDRRLDPEGAQHPHPADAEDELLVETHLAAADVEDVRDRPVGVVVLGDVGVEQEDRRPADLDAPDRDLEVAARAARR